MEQANRQNCIIVDWLSFTVLDPVAPDDLIRFLGIPTCYFKEGTGFERGYSHSYFYENISINYNPNRSDMGINVRMTGSGFRAFETYSNCPDFIDLLTRIKSTFVRFNITRFDLAYDDYEGRIKFNKVCRSIKNQALFYFYGKRGEVEKALKYVANQNSVYSPAKVRKYKYELSDDGECAYVGSRSSDMLVRFYDKAAERGVDFPWIRCELQMRHGIADQITTEFITADNISDLFFSRLNGYCQFVKDKDIKNAGRSKLQPWFKKWISTRYIYKYSRATNEYNLEKTHDWILGTAANNLRMYLEVFGYADLRIELDKRKPVSELPPKMQSELTVFVLAKLRQFRHGYFDRGDFVEYVDERPLHLLKLAEELEIPEEEYNFFHDDLKLINDA